MVRPGDDGAPLVFANALSGVAPASFAEALQHAMDYTFLIIHEGAEVSEYEARLVSKRFEEAARREYERLQMVGGVTNTGTA
jgi:hypothetical protein